MDIKTKRLSELDLLRFLASLSVLFYHRLFVPPTPLPLWHGAQFGFFGVELFFMISGFVILMTAAKRGWYEFLASRIARLLPSFWVALTLTTLAVLIVGEDIGLRQWVANATMLPKYFHEPPIDTVYWTLELEIKFYGLVLLLVLLKQIAHIERYLAGWLVLCVFEHWVPRLNILTLSGYAPYFVAGCLFYLMREKATLLRAGLLLASLALAVPHGIDTAVTNSPKFPTPQKALIAALIVLMEYALFATVALRWWRLPDWKLWPWLGAMTYPLYLMHYRIGIVLFDAFPTWSPAARQTLGLVVPLMLALLLAATTERYACPWLQRWITARKRGVPSRSESPTPAVPAARQSSS